VPKKNKQKSEGYCHQSMETVIDPCSSSSDEEEEEPGDIEKHCAVPDDAYFASATSIKPTSNDKNSTLRQINPPSRKSLDIMSYSSTTSYKCVICGSSLQHITTLKGRVLHLKQCSKKYGIQARDLCIKDDNDDHGEITNDEQEMELTCINNESNIINTQAKTISSCFSNLNESSKPPRTLNTILMDNAKRLAKCNNIIKKNVPGNKGVIPQKKTTTWKRRPFKNVNGDYCPSYKRITGTDIICDGFYYASPKLSKTYFLSHFHYDHYGGITSSWNHGTIYCSTVTANLVHQQLGVQKCYLHPLELLTPTVIESRGKPITVTLLDANHCPGAVMFLFQIGTMKIKNILHVGDFRWNREVMLQKSSPLLPFTTLGTSSSLQLDELYLDTTYCDESYSNIPSQREAIDATLKVVEREIAECNKRRLKPLILFGSYAIGKERLYLEICERLRVKALVDKKRYKTLAALNLPPEKMNLLTTRAEETFVRIVPLPHINFKHMPSYYSAAGGTYALSRPFDCIIGFRPTGWTISEKKSNHELISKRTNGKLSIYGVPYSEHSNFLELIDCLNCLKPKKIIPTVSASKSDEQVQLLLTSLDRRKE